ncbi:phosphatase PAP2 family protein [Verrucomicrobia bacterium]|jgi:membrane-associated phospholipid phosphatase|nr:phosphatase PAP2 family protein [Verrucomicrobiota bacterium]MDA7657359.1 phosphatase PAP2 family protein [Verrucomicrobiota bacterium]
METQFVIWIQEKELFLFWPIRLLSELGPSTTFGIFLAGLYWCWDYTIMCRVWMVNSFSMWFTSTLKHVFHTPRPYWVEPEVKGLASASGFGMPSGHALVATSVWTQLGRSWRGGQALWVCFVIVLGVGFSRLFLGVHSVAQVVVGMVLGLGIAFSVPAVERRISGPFNKMRMGSKLATVFACSLIACAISLSVRFLLTAWELPSDWIEMAREKRPQDGVINPLSLHAAFLSASSSAGIMAGYLLLTHFKMDQNAETWGNRAWRILIGAALLGPYVIYTRRFIHGDSVTALPLAGALTVDYGYGMFTGLLISLVMPVVFCRLKV